MSTWSLPDASFGECAEFAVANGFPALEIALLDPLRLRRQLTAGSATEAVGPAAGALSLSIHAPTAPTLVLAADDPDRRAASYRLAREVLEYAATVGAGPVVFHLEGEPARRTPAEKRERHRVLAGPLAGLAAYGAERGVQVTLENTPPSLPTDLSGGCGPLAELIERTGSPSLAATADIGHAAMEGGIEALEPLLPAVAHWHVHDNNLGADNHFRLGGGSVPWQELAANHWRGTDATLVLEIYAENGLGDPDPARGAIASRQLILDFHRSL